MKNSFISEHSSISKKLKRHSVSKKIFPFLGIFVLFLCAFTVAGKSADAAESISATEPGADFDVSENVNSGTVGGLATSAKGFEIIILSSYKETMNIGETKILVAASTAGSELSFKSSNSAVAAVDMYGIITAKKAGSCLITAKSKGAEARCALTVVATTITLNTKKISIENGASFQMTAKTSSGSPVAWKSSKQSVAIISDAGLIEAIKPGTTTITATADGSKETCQVTVMKPSIKLSKETLTLYRGQSYSLTATSTSNKSVTWKSSKKSVAVVDEHGNVTAIKHGETRISATLDGVTRYCVVTVAAPTITLNKTKISIKKGQTFSLKATVSSGNIPTYKCSSKTVASVSSKGVIKAKKKGTCTVTVTEDGATAKCKVTVTE